LEKFGLSIGQKLGLMWSFYKPSQNKSKCPWRCYKAAQNAHILPVCSAFSPLCALPGTPIFFLRWLIVQPSIILFTKVSGFMTCNSFT
jgi:hypothetical protein